jgi:hypothetical protein
MARVKHDREGEQWVLDSLARQRVSTVAALERVNDPVEHGTLADRLIKIDASIKRWEMIRDA